MIIVMLAMNKDGYVMRDSVIGFPPSFIEYDNIQSLFENALIMTTFDMVRRNMPPHIARVSRKSLLAENDDALCKMAVNLAEKDGVGDIVVLANEEILDDMDYLGAGYRLAIIFPEGTEIPGELVTGMRKVEELTGGKYCAEVYAQSVADATDTQISDAIDGIEEYLNFVDSMDKRDKSAVEKIAENVRRLNNALSRENSDGNFSDDYGEFGDVGNCAIEDEIDQLWYTMQLAGDQLSDITDLVLDTQETLMEVLKYIKHELPIPQIRQSVRTMHTEIDGLRNQLGLHIEESVKKETEKPKKDKVKLALIAWSAVLTVLTVINLLL